MALQIPQIFQVYADNKEVVLVLLLLMACVWFAGSYFRDRIRAHDEEMKEVSPLS